MTQRRYSHIVALLAPLFVLAVVAIYALAASLHNTDTREISLHAGLSSGVGFGSGITSSANDYLDAIAKEGVYRWRPEQMPLRVYIKDGMGVPGYRSSYRQLLVNAFNEWCRQSNGILSWQEVNSPRGADIACDWTDNPTVHPGTVEAGQTKSLVQQNRYSGEGRIISATVSLLTALNGRAFDDNNMYKTCLHEVGHALGLQGHSDVPSDIMYPMVNGSQIARLQDRDLNTMMRLYTDDNFVAMASQNAVNHGGLSMRRGNRSRRQAPQFGFQGSGRGYYQQPSNDFGNYNQSFGDSYGDTGAQFYGQSPDNGGYSFRSPRRGFRHRTPYGGYGFQPVPMGQGFALY